MVSSVITHEIATLPVTSDSISERVQIATNNAVRIEDVSVVYNVDRKGKRTVLENISLDIEEGECVVLLGETGCGKSTLLRLLLG
jgi:NitT/TauT family transport system ATP-binding protein